MVKNKSKTYLLPLLSELVGFEKRYHKNIKNTYINFDQPHLKNCIGILQEFSFKVPEFTSYEHRFINNELFVELHDLDDNKVLYIFKFPEEYLHEYNCFKKGKYSKYGIDAKTLILEYFGHVYENNINAVPFLMKIKQILFKDKKLKRKIEKQLDVVLSDDAELSDVPNLDNELFKIKKIKKQQKK